MGPPSPLPEELCSFIKYAIKRHPWLWREKYIFDLAFVAAFCVSLYCVFFLSTCNCNLSSSTNFQDIWNPAKSFNLGQSCRDTPHRHFFFLSCWQNGNHRQMSARHPLPFSYPVLEGFRKFLAYFVK